MQHPLMIKVGNRTMNAATRYSGRKLIQCPTSDAVGSSNTHRETSSNMCLAIPGKITRFTDADRHFAHVSVSGVEREINVDLLRDDGIGVGDWVLIHVGFAMSQISAVEAEDQIRFLTELGEAGAADDEFAGYQFGGQTPTGPDGGSNRASALSDRPTTSNERASLAATHPDADDAE